MQHPAKFVVKSRSLHVPEIIFCKKKIENSTDSRTGRLRYIYIL